MSTYSNPNLISSSTYYFCSYNMVKEEVLICVAGINQSDPSDYRIDLSQVVYLSNNQKDSDLVSILNSIGIFSFSLISTGHNPTGSYHLLILLN